MMSSEKFANLLDDIGKFRERNLHSYVQFRIEDSFMHLHRD